MRARRLERSKPATRAAAITPTMQDMARNSPGRPRSPASSIKQCQYQPGDAEVLAGHETPDQRAEAHGREAGRSEAQRVALVPAQAVLAAPERGVHEAVGHGGDDCERERRVGLIDSRGSGAQNGERRNPAGGNRADRRHQPRAKGPRAMRDQTGPRQGSEASTPEMRAAIPAAAYPYQTSETWSARFR